MNEYIIALSLSYFKEKRENYIISELMEILGYNSKQINVLISELMQKEYIKYFDDLLGITTKGITFLISSDQSKIEFQTEEYKMPHINPNKALSVDQPYVPTNFTQKYNG